MGLGAMEKGAESVCGLSSRKQQEYEVNCLMGCFTMCSKVQLKCDGTRGTGEEVKGKLVNGVGSQYSSHYLGTWCIQHYYRRCTHLGCQ
jgi:hypothetical protein